MTDSDRLAARICQNTFGHGRDRYGVAVSGGSDSVALLRVLAAGAREAGVVIEAATIDHGLRVEAAAEAEFVKSLCERLDIHHETLRWEGWDGQGNLQAAAREARYRLLADWARRRGIDIVALGHTRDDQAETFLMQLARGAGLKGLTAIGRDLHHGEITFIRPALSYSREVLRDILRRLGQDWCDDPSNDDLRFDRVKARRALVALGDLGIDSRTIQRVTGHLLSADTAINGYMREKIETSVYAQSGDVVIDRAAFQLAGSEVLLRVLAEATLWVGGGDYPPRGQALRRLLGGIVLAQVRTLNGCLVTSGPDTIRVSREYNAVKDMAVPLGEIWDRRWSVTGPARPGLEVRALGEAVSQCGDWRETGLPRTSLLAAPAVWDGETLVAAPLAGEANGYRATFHAPKRGFSTLLRGA